MSTDPNSFDHRDKEPDCLINAVGMSREYRIGTRVIPVLNGIDFAVKKGEFVAVMGPSGSGKSTLLHILGCLDRPSAGMYRFDGMDVLSASDRELSRIRANYIGFVFQTFNLIPALSVYENIELPFLYSFSDTTHADKRILEAVDQVGLEKRINHRPAELSGGEMQRVAIARALSISPKLILADEPTGNLDTETGRGILALFENLHHQGATIVMITHDSSVADRAQRCIHLKDGVVEENQQ
jgi:ABC-type lipoprotein export system ATPase subunit